MPQECGKLGSNYIKVPNSETYNTHWLMSNLNDTSSMKKFENTWEKKSKILSSVASFECVGHTDYHNVAAYCTLHYINMIKKCDR